MAHEHEFEAQPGLPERLPAGERILWQGAPSAWALAVHAFHLRKLALYFGAMLAVQAAALGLGGQPLASPLLMSAALIVLTLGFVASLAWMSARTTLYTLTTRRIVMRIGIVLTLSYNLPLVQIAGASLRPLGDGQRPGPGLGDVALSLQGSQRIAWLHLWPHARPWHVKCPQPMLRCLPDATAVGALIQQAWLAVHPGERVQLGAAPAPVPLPPGLQTVA